MLGVTALVSSLVTLYVIAAAAAVNKEFSDGDIHVRLLGKSGKMLLWREANDNNKSTPMEIFLDELIERDANGRQVGKKGSTKHSFNTFASQDFAFSKIEEGRLPYSNVTAKYISFDSSLKGLSSKVKFVVYIIKDDGDVTLKGETQRVFKGQVKFTLELRDWTWCGCTGEAQGVFVDVTVTVKSRGQPKIKGTKRPGRPVRFDMGGANSDMTLSQKVKVDNDDWTDMEDGYPMMQVRGSKNSFTFRFPRFTNKVYYDPTLTIESLTGNSSGHAANMSAIVLLLMAMAVTSISAQLTF